MFSTYALEGQTDAMSQIGSPTCGPTLQNLNSACEISRCYVSFDLAMSKNDMTLAESRLSM
jgi:hypothetical protein